MCHVQAEQERQQCPSLVGRAPVLVLLAFHDRDLAGGAQRLSQHTNRRSPQLAARARVSGAQGRQGQSKLLPAGDGGPAAACALRHTPIQPGTAALRYASCPSGSWRSGRKRLSTRPWRACGDRQVVEKVYVLVERVVKGRDRRTPGRGVNSSVCGTKQQALKGGRKPHQHGTALGVADPRPHRSHRASILCSRQGLGASQARWARWAGGRDGCAAGQAVGPGRGGSGCLLLWPGHAGAEGSRTS